MCVCVGGGRGQVFRAKIRQGTSGAEGRPESHVRASQCRQSHSGECSTGGCGPWNPRTLPCTSMRDSGRPLMAAAPSYSVQREGGLQGKAGGNYTQPGAAAEAAAGRGGSSDDAGSALPGSGRWGKRPRIFGPKAADGAHAPRGGTAPKEGEGEEGSTQVAAATAAAACCSTAMVRSCPSPEGQLAAELRRCTPGALQPSLRACGGKLGVLMGPGQALAAGQRQRAAAGGQ